MACLLPIPLLHAFSPTPGRWSKQVVAHPPPVLVPQLGLVSETHVLGSTLGQNGVPRSRTCVYHLGTCDCKGQGHEVACRSPGPLPCFLPSRNPRPLVKPHGLERMLGRATAWLVWWPVTLSHPGPASFKHFIRARQEETYNHSQHPPGPTSCLWPLEALLIVPQFLHWDGSAW